MSMEPINTSTTTTIRVNKRRSERNAIKSNSADRAQTLYDVDFTFCVIAPSDRISHIPSAGRSATTSKDQQQQMCICRQFLETGSCSAEDCPNVHADIDGLERNYIHINYSWTSLDHVSYSRLPSGDTLTVLAPNNRPPLEQLASEHVLVTKGSQSHAGPIERPLSHCAHYYFNRICNRGANCSFVHSVNIDPCASAGQRAPAPQVVHRSAKSTAVSIVVSRTCPTTAAASEAGYHSDASSVSVSCAGAAHAHNSACQSPSSNGTSVSSPTNQAELLSAAALSYDSDTNSSKSNSSAQLSARSITPTATQCFTTSASGCRVLIFSQDKKESVAYRYNPYAMSTPLISK